MSRTRNHIARQDSAKNPIPIHHTATIENWYEEFLNQLFDRPESRKLGKKDKDKTIKRWLSDNLESSAHAADRRKKMVELTLSHVVECGISISGKKDVSDYLEKHQDLIPLVAVTGSKICENFGRSAQVSLEMFRSMEEDDEYLTIIVRKKKYDDDLMKILDKISEDYLDQHLTHSSGYLLLTTDFKIIG